MLQTKVTDSNIQNFYKSVYFMQTDSREQLIDLTEFNNTCIIIDCCGAHYKTVFEKDVIILETIRSAKEYKFSRDQFDKLIDNQQDNNIVWPTVNVTTPVLVLDRSPLLKYQSISSICKIISQAAEKYHASKIVVRHKLIFVDDLRTTDRFYNFQDFKIKNYCVEKFSYNTTVKEYFIQLRRITIVE
jgi:hypothetical protein